MLTINRDKTKVFVLAAPAYPIGGTTFRFEYDAGAEWAANLLWYNLHERQSAELRRIREEAYSAGWKDAKAHKPKCKWFASVWEPKF